MAAEGKIVNAAGGRIESPLILRLDKATSAVILFRLDAAIGTVVLLRLDAARGPVLRLFVDAITGALLLLPGVPRGGPKTNGPLPDGFHLDSAAVVQFRLDAAPDAVVPLRFAVATGVVVLLRLDTATGAVLLLRPDAAMGVVPQLRPDAATGALPPLCLAAAADPDPLLRLDATADAAPLLRLAVAANAAPLLRLAAFADAAPPLRHVVAADATHALRLDTVTGAVHPFRLAEATGAPPPLCLAAAADTAQQLHLAAAAHQLVSLLVDAVLNPPSSCTPPKGLATQNTTGATTRLKTRNSRIVGKRKKVQILNHASRGNNNKLLRFKGLLGDFVWFAVPSVLLFYPKKVESVVHQSKLQVSWTWWLGLFDTGDLEKEINMIFFVIFVSIWILAYLLASLGRGRNCTKIVKNLTFATVLSVMAFIDYGLYKSTSPSILYMALFVLHFIVMASFITRIWMKYVYGTNQVLELFKKIKGWMSHRSQPEQAQPEQVGLKEPLLTCPNIV